MMVGFENLGFLKKIGDMAASIAEYMTRNFLQRLLYSSDTSCYDRALEELEVPIGLYIHIPYCHNPVCTFCCFVRYPLRDRSRIREYHASLRMEAEILASRAEGARIESIYVGGGTPSIDVEELAETLDIVKSVFGAKTARVSVEVHPRDVDSSLVESLKGLVHRVSMGVQALDPDRLQRIGRRNSSIEEAIKAVGILRGKFETLNLDMVWGVPGDTPSVVRREARNALQLGAEQITFYPVMPSPSTREALRASRASVWSNAEPYMYAAILEEAYSLGYKPCTPWCMGRGSHSLIDEYIVETPYFLALGVSGISRLPGCVSVNAFSVTRYSELVAKGVPSVENAIKTTCIESAFYTILSLLFGLEYRTGTLEKLHGRCASTVESLVGRLLALMGEDTSGDEWRITRFTGLYLLHRIQHAVYTALAAFRYAKLSYASRQHPPRLQ